MEKQKKIDTKVVEWRNMPFHRRCKFCKYLKFMAVPAHMPGVDYYKCIAKDKIIGSAMLDMTNVRRPFCKLFEVKVEE